MRDYVGTRAVDEVDEHGCQPTATYPRDHSKCIITRDERGAGLA